MLEFHQDSRASRSRRRNLLPRLARSLALVGIAATLIVALYGAQLASG